ncbi:MAG: SDR family oxidoreductase [Alphaproteobacteria bacterium]|jgi:NAD(P)-dependent dehydrogenase (short-subunit alcohol dehydrogenase family)|nr:SDR family oxidoreductase [Alphaproteobacteria bacterium]MDP6565961.1 SDR family oxidoreductase [Alphaproteobacteria bacterium]MDP6814314.1 SDR family oxidoreductase [Alphaproteobacteria bacterium]
MSSNVIDMNGKVVLITGGSRGLGRAMALGFAEAGADVAITSRRIESCQATAAEVEALGRRALAHACHVGYWQQCDELVEAVYQHFGRVDVLINNAGMSPLYNSPVEISEELYDKVLDVNLKGTFRLCASVGQRMVDGNGGAIINVSSMAAVHPRKDIITYAAAKAGVNALTEAFADAYGPKVRVNCIMPGPFLTDISKAWNMDAFEERAESRINLKRGGEPEEIVGAALYLASDHASYTTAAILRVDGGSN